MIIDLSPLIRFRSLMTRLNPLIKELNEVTTMEESGVESADSAGELVI